MPSTHVIVVVTVLAGGADDVRVWLRAVADEVMRYLYVVSSINAGASLLLAGLLVAVAAITLIRNRPERTTNVEAGEPDASCRAPTRRGSRDAWTSRRSIVFSRPRARSGGVSI
jgi:hypothetical protein